jgi:phage terminase large subunit-like protein
MQKINIDTTIGRYIGRKAYGGIDLSATQDLTCLVWIFPWKHDAEGFDVVMRTWCPRERVYDPKNRYRDMYQAWEKMGYLEPTAGNVIDYQYVRQRLLDDASRLKLCRIGVDRYFRVWFLSASERETRRI